MATTPLKLPLSHLSLPTTISRAGHENGNGKCLNVRMMNKLTPNQKLTDLRVRVRSDTCSCSGSQKAIPPLKKLCKSSGSDNFTISEDNNSSSNEGKFSNSGSDTQSSSSKEKQNRTTENAKRIFSSIADVFTVLFKYIFCIVACFLFVGGCVLTLGVILVSNNRLKRLRNFLVGLKDFVDTYGWLFTWMNDILTIYDIMKNLYEFLVSFVKRDEGDKDKEEEEKGN